MSIFSAPQKGFIAFPSQWVFDLSADDLKKMMILHFRFKYFAEMALAEGEDVRKCYFESQEALCSLFGMAPSSRSKISKFLQRMEKAGYISITREKVLLYGSLKPRHYIIVNDPRLLSRYDLK